MHLFLSRQIVSRRKFFFGRSPQRYVFMHILYACLFHPCCHAPKGQTPAQFCNIIFLLLFSILTNRPFVGNNLRANRANEYNAINGSIYFSFFFLGYKPIRYSTRKARFLIIKSFLFNRHKSLRGKPLTNFFLRFSSRRI